MKKRIFCLIFAVIMISTVLASCSDGWNGYKDTNLDEFVKVGEYKGIEIDPSKYTVKEATEEEIEGYIESELEKISENRKVFDRKTKAGDIVSFSFTVIVDGNVVDNLGVESTSLVAGGADPNKYLSGISQLIIGRNIGDKVEFTTAYPKDYKDENSIDANQLAGKTATYQITIKEILEFYVPELNDETVTKLSDTAKTVEEYKAEVKGIIDESKKEQSEINIRRDAWIKVVEASEVLAYPKSELNKVKNEVIASTKETAKLYGIEYEDYLEQVLKMDEAAFEKQAEDYAKTTVKDFLVVFAIAKAENISISDEEYQAGLNEYYENYYSADFESVQKLEEYFGKDQIEEGLYYDKVIEFIFDNAKISANL